jgi:predicted transcriptional regulator
MSLSDLIVNKGEIEEELVEKAISDYFRYTDGGKIIVLMDKMKNIPQDKKVLYLLAASVGTKFLPSVEQPTSFGNEDIAKKLNINKNSVRVYISKLNSLGLITKKNSKSGLKYQITTQGLYELARDNNDE